MSLSSTPRTRASCGGPHLHAGRAPSTSGAERPNWPMRLTLASGMGKMASGSGALQGSGMGNTVCETCGTGSRSHLAGKAMCELSMKCTVRVGKPALCFFFVMLRGRGQALWMGDALFFFGPNVCPCMLCPLPLPSPLLPVPSLLLLLMPVPRHHLHHGVPPVS